VDTDQLRRSYESMAFIRAFENRLNDLFLQGIVAGTTHLCVGQEACSEGVCAALSADDVLFSNHRGHGHLLARGADPARLMGEIFGSPMGFSGGRGGSQHIAVKEINFLGTHGITAGTIPLAVGTALHRKIHDEPGVAVVFFGDGAIGEGIFHESLNMAAIWGLRVLFVCENNEYAMSTAHREFSPVANAADRAVAYGMKSAIVDGNDVVAVAEQTRLARQTIVDGPEPFFLELKTFRVSGHSRGDKCDYRSREEEAEWRQKDALDRARTRLAECGAWNDDDEAAMQTHIEERLAAAEAQAREGAAAINA
jgi:pyruvate dehydrogenase E1 component alpha subunit